LGPAVRRPTMDDLSIPDFLIARADDNSWAGRKLTKPVKGSVKITRNEHPDTRRFRLEMEKAERAKKRERILFLRQNYGK
jgi:hypothetical protein